MWGEKGSVGLTGQVDSLPFFFCGYVAGEEFIPDSQLSRLVPRASGQTQRCVDGGEESVSVGFGDSLG